MLRKYVLKTDSYQQLKTLHYSLSHDYAWRGAKYYSRSIPQRDLAALMGPDPSTYNKYYGSYTDETNLIETVERIATWLHI